MSSSAPGRDRARRAGAELAARLDEHDRGGPRRCGGRPRAASCAPATSSSRASCARPASTASQELPGGGARRRRVPDGPASACCRARSCRRRATCAADERADAGRVRRRRRRHGIGLGHGLPRRTTRSRWSAPSRTRPTAGRSSAAPARSGRSSPCARAARALGACLRRARRDPRLAALVLCRRRAGDRDRRARPRALRGARSTSAARSSTTSTSCGTSSARAPSSSRRSTRSRRTPSWCSPPTASRRPSAAGDERGDLKVIDATCPLVAKVHTEARRYAAQGYNLVLIGHADHEEVDRHARRGTGPLPPRGGRASDVAALELDAGRARSPTSPRRRSPPTRRPRSSRPCARRFPDIVGAAGRRHLLRHPEPPGRRARSSPTGATSCSWWARRTRPTPPASSRWRGGRAAGPSSSRTPRSCELGWLAGRRHHRPHGRRLGARRAGARSARHPPLARAGSPERGDDVPKKPSVSPSRRRCADADSPSPERPHRCPPRPAPHQEDQVLPVHRRDRAALRLQPVLPGLRQDPAPDRGPAPAPVRRGRARRRRGERHADGVDRRRRAACSTPTSPAWSKSS